jgi:hypothetical protein
MGKKKRMTRDELIAELVETDENFRRLHDRVVAMNGGRLPTAQEIDRRFEEAIARYRAAS